MNKNDEWYTPNLILEKVREVLGTIDVDPASSAIAQEVVRAKEFYTEEDNGLDFEWEGSVWCNPPYSNVLLKKFTNEFVKQYETGIIKEGIILTNSGTDTLWNQTLAPYLQAYTLGRISFRKPDGTETGKGGRGQVFTYVGKNPSKFIEVFTREGFCWIPNYGYLTI